MFYTGFGVVIDGGVLFYTIEPNQADSKGLLNLFFKTYSNHSLDLVTSH